MKKKPNPLFIFGSARAGTTLLRLMLNMHSEIAIPPESHFLLHVLKKYPPTAMLNESEVAEVLTIIVNHPRFQFWNIPDVTATLTDQIKAPVSLAELVDQLFRLQIKPTQKPRWGDKTPAYFTIIPELKKMFPQAQMIAYVRDGRDVAISLKQQGWHGWCIYQRARYWQTCAERMTDLKKERNSFFLRYEELISDPENTLKRLCAYLEIGFEPQMLAYDQQYKNNITADEQKIGIHKKLARKPTKKDKERWKVESSTFEVWAFESVAYDTLQKSGYAIAFYNRHNWLHRLGGNIYAIFGKSVALLQNTYSSSPARRIKDKIKSFFQ